MSRFKFPLDERLSEAEAARYVDREPATMARWRREGKGPTWYRLSDTGRAPVFYMIADLDAFIEETGKRETACVTRKK